MTNPPNEPRDDRRMHEGDKKGVGQPVNEARQDEVTPGGEPGQGETERSRPAQIEEEVERRSNA